MSFKNKHLLRIGGESGIRTHGRFNPSPVFKTGALNRSAISPIGSRSPGQRRILAREGHLPKTTRSEEHTSELQSQSNLVCRLLLEKKKKIRCHDNVSSRIKADH